MPFRDPEARRAYHREYMKTYLDDNPQKKAEHLARVRINTVRSNAEKRKWIAEYLADHPCVDCGEADLDVLDFDHVRGVKLFTIAMAVRNGRSLQAIISEIEKCEVRCANCHRRVTRRRERAASNGA
jgi:hypothetical protein